MCGIFGLVAGSASDLTAGDFGLLLRQLFLLSESRGKEASGLALVREDRIEVVRKPVPASEMLESRDFRDLMSEALGGAGPARGLAAIGHARLVTSGMQGIDANNQPVVKHDLVCVHNGIIVNEGELWAREPGIAKTSGVDTEVLAALLHREVAARGSIEGATRRVFERIFGEASVAVVAGAWDVLMVATNTGSLYLAENAALGVAFFTSERIIAQRVIAALPRAVAAGFAEPRQLRPGTGSLVSLRSGRRTAEFLLSGAAAGEAPAATRPARAIVTSAQRALESWRAMRRCARCVLPETMPFIEFDAEGVCNYCRSHRPVQLKGRAALESVLQRYRSRDGSPDCLIAFSGGRDSSYGLHLLKRELGMTPVAYTYDWGMVTDLARRNQARLCGRLGVEHIWVSADIKRKRDNIRKNVEAWLRKPDLGMVPLFMAGDKQFMYHANRMMRETGIRLMVYANNHFERTEFKWGFCGVPPAGLEIRVNRLSHMRKARLVAYYLSRFLGNPGYLNSSLLDTFSGFLSYYFVNQDFLYLFDYLPWDEAVVNRTLVEHYDWEFATDTKTSWRIGDGTAPFYNYIYRTIAGFSEYETFRSNQVREGQMSREQALRLIEEENGPRYESILEYCRTIRVDFDHAMRVIDSAPRLYRRRGTSPPAGVETRAAARRGGGDGIKPGLAP
jgi:tRNA(Ile)-lysidine synthase TilS/MesJ